MPELKGNSGLLLDGSVGVGDGLLPLDLGLGFLFLCRPFPLLVEIQVTPVVQIVKYAGRVLQPKAALWVPCIEVDTDYGIVLPAVSLAVREFFQAKLFDLLFAAGVTFLRCSSLTALATAPSKL